MKQVIMVGDKLVPYDDCIGAIKRVMDTLAKAVDTEDAAAMISVEKGDHHVCSEYGTEYEDKILSLAMSMSHLYRLVEMVARTGNNSFDEVIDALSEIHRRKEQDEK